jgi:hypothetical protein
MRETNESVPRLLTHDRGENNLKNHIIHIYYTLITRTPSEIPVAKSRDILETRSFRHLPSGGSESNRTNISAFDAVTVYVREAPERLTSPPNGER